MTTTPSTSTSGTKKPLPLPIGGLSQPKQRQQSKQSQLQLQLQLQQQQQQPQKPGELYRRLQKSGARPRKSLSQHKDYLRVWWLFVSPFSGLFGVTSYVLRVSPAAIVARIALMLAAFILTMVTAFSLVPKYEHTCCYRPGIPTDLGSCTDPDSVIHFEPIGRLKQHCGAYPARIVICILVATGLWIAALLVWRYEWWHVKKMYVRREHELEAQILALGEEQLVMDDAQFAAFQTAYVHTLNATLLPPRRYVWLSNMRWVPDIYLLPVLMRAYGKRTVGNLLAFVHATTLVLIGIYLYEETMYRSWWRCYKPGTSIYSLTHGMCNVRIYARNYNQFKWIIWIVVSQLCALGLFVGTGVQVHYEHIDPEVHLSAIRHLPPAFKSVFSSYIVQRSWAER